MRQKIPSIVPNRGQWDSFACAGSSIAKIFPKLTQVSLLKAYRYRKFLLNALSCLLIGYVLLKSGVSP